MQALDVAVVGPPRVELDALDAMAELARETGLVVHVVAPRDQRLLERAREIAEQGGLEVSTNVLTHTTSVRFRR